MITVAPKFVDTPGSTSTGSSSNVPVFTDELRAAGIKARNRDRYQRRPFCEGDIVIPGHEAPSGAAQPPLTLAGEFCAQSRMAGGGAVGDYNNDGLEDIFITSQSGPSELLRNRGDGTFASATRAANITVPKFASAAVFLDVDADGDEDLFVSTLGGTRSYLFINNGRGVFTEEAEERGVALQLGRKLMSFTPAVGDVDGDGFVELFTTEYVTFAHTAHTPSASRLFRNLGPAKPGYFTDVTDAAGVNRDFLINATEAETFTIFGQSVQDFGGGFADLDGDGLQELVVIGDSFMLQVYWNNGDWTFTPCISKGGKPWLGQCGYTPTEGPMGLAFGDIDHDGMLDMFATSPGPRAVLSRRREVHYDNDALVEAVGNRLYFNRGNRTFGCKGPSCRDHAAGARGETDILSKQLVEDGSLAASTYWGVASGGWGWAAMLFDFDNDADLDTIMTNGYSVAGDTYYDEWTHWPKFLWRNDGGLWAGDGDGDGNSSVTGHGALRAEQERTRTVSTDVGHTSGITTTGQGRGLLVFDYNNDGNVDTMLFNQYGDHHLYRNHGVDNGNGWLRVRALHAGKGAAVEPRPTDSYGARVTVRCPPLAFQQLAEVGAASHFMGQSERWVHFGLGSVCTAASVTVAWPGWGNATVTVEGVPTNTSLKVLRPRERGAKVQHAWADLAPCPSAVITVFTSEEDITSRDGAAVGTSPTRHTATYLFRDDVQDAPRALNDSFDIRLAVGRGHFSLFRVTLTAGPAARPSNATSAAAGTARTAGTAGTAGMALPKSGLTLADFDNNAHRTFGISAVKRMVRLCKDSGYADDLNIPAGACNKTRPFGTDRASCPFAQHFSRRPGGSLRPGARHVSNSVHAQAQEEGGKHVDIPDSRGLNDLHANFGQFISHDISIQTQLTMQDIGNNQLWYDDFQFPIPIPTGDSHFDPDNTSGLHLPFARSKDGRLYGPTRTDGKIRSPLNWVSPQIDASMVYGSSEAVSRVLREGTGGRMKITDRGLPTRHEVGVPVANPTGQPEELLMRAGDSRVNVQPGIVALHALFLREHNRLANLYRAMDPTAPDAVLFHRARRMVIAELQAITFREYLPALLGKRVKEVPGAYKIRRPSVEFATAAFRFGHSQVGNFVARLGPGFADDAGGPLRLMQTYFTPGIVADQGIGVFLRGAAYQRAQEVDLVMNEDVRNNLFPTVNLSTAAAAGGGTATGSRVGALDLAAINIQRGRDHGLPDYVSARRQFGLSPVASYSDIVGNTSTAQRLLHTYGPLRHFNLDMWVGGLAEEHTPGSSVGELFGAIIEYSFATLRADDDRWYTSHLTVAEVDYVHHLSLGQIIRLNTDVEELAHRDNAFFSFQSCAAVVNHQCVPRARAGAPATSTAGPAPPAPAPDPTTSSAPGASATAASTAASVAASVAAATASAPTAAPTAGPTAGPAAMPTEFRSTASPGQNTSTVGAPPTTRSPSTPRVSQPQGSTTSAPASSTPAPAGSQRGGVAQRPSATDPPSKPESSAPAGAAAGKNSAGPGCANGCPCTECGSGDAPRGGKCDGAGASSGGTVAVGIAVAIAAASAAVSFLLGACLGHRCAAAPRGGRGAGRGARAFVDNPHTGADHDTGQVPDQDTPAASSARFLFEIDVDELRETTT